MTKTKTSLLIIEDDLSISVMLKTWLAKNGFDIKTAINTKEARRQIKKKTADIILSDIRLPDGDGLELMKWAQTVNKVPVILMTSYAEISTAVNAIKSGASDFICKPLNHEELLLKIQQVIADREKYETENAQAEPEPLQYTAIFEKYDKQQTDEQHEKPKYINGQSEQMQQIYKYIDIIAPTSMSVLILGESGVGKERIARMIHEKSNRKNGPYVAVDCGVLSKELAVSEFFGHIKGSFTGAINNKKGFFQTAHGGTIFLDETGNLPLDVQAQLLRALQERKIRPVGSEKDFYVDVRIVSATNEKIDITLPNPSFRLDLYYRLSDFIIQIPSLRECQDDIPLYINHFIELANDEFGKTINKITDEAIEILTKYQWFGNLREMKNTIRIAALLSKNDEIAVEDLPDNIKYAAKPT